MIYESFLEKMGVIWTVTGLARTLQFSCVCNFLVDRNGGFSYFGIIVFPPVAEQPNKLNFLLLEDL
jgi:hypothetical protein